MRLAELTWMQVEEYLKGDDRAVLPLGAQEQHAYLALATDAILSERVSVEAADPLGVPVLPALPFGMSHYFLAYPGTISIGLAAYQAVVLEILESLRRHGFRRLLIVNGHGGNSPAATTVGEWVARNPEMKVRWHDWWAGPEFAAAARTVRDDGSHANWMESFPWNRGQAPPANGKPAVELEGFKTLTPERARARLGDGSFGGVYQVDDAQMLRIWTAAVAEVRALLESGLGPASRGSR